ncbi:Eco57I restriction-modification methylase domain-containing protein [Scytonema sp. PRP1]|uniref:Eco57I restriction-modification methylase domain-containing protein n=1 Tax=Scytonema sp. PRP1 TaxID=3120513 RepID=UPI00300C8DF9
MNRRQTGTHYTPRNLTEEIVQYTLEPLVYEGVAEGKPKEAWRLRSPAELLQLKICDMAMGSGAFLVQTCRYLAEKLVEAWQQMEAEHPGQVVIAPEGTLSAALPEECPIPKDADERLVVARRIVADRCLYGVDKNPLAVEMAKLSLWLITLAKGRPFTFVDHALKWGDSLLGITRPEQIEFLKLNPEKEAVQLRTVSDRWKPFVQRAIAKRQELENFSSSVITDIQKKEQLNREAEAAIAHVRHVGDFLVAEALAQAGKTSDLTDEEIQVLAEVVIEALDEADAEKRNREIAAILAKTERMMNLGNPENQTPRKPFHWLLEFPEVFLQEDAPKGFAAIVGNPPFMKGNNISGILGSNYRDFLVEQISKGKKGSADICAYFFLRVQELIQGSFGLLATNTISQGDTREVGLLHILDKGSSIYRAVSSQKWFGTSANVEVSVVWIYRDSWLGEVVLDEETVPDITSLLKVSGKVTGQHQRLISNKGISFIGSQTGGTGFVLTTDEAYKLIEKNNKNKDVLYPFLSGEDFNSRPDQSPSRWVINFFDWALDAEHDDPKNPKGHPYASDYADCLEIVRQRVKPERDNNNRKERRERWWQYAEKCPALYSAIQGYEKVLFHGFTSKYLGFGFAPGDIVYSAPHVVIQISEYCQFAALQASLHEAWVLNYCSTMRTDIRYAPSDVFETFPFPTPDPSDLSTQFPTLNTIGEIYYTHRQAIMRERQEGLTKTYNRFHDANETASDIQTLRELHIEMDQAVAAAYSWQDLDLGHGFHKTKQGIRFTISETARREVLDRLLELNHQRYAEEVAQGLHDKKKSKGKGQKTKGKKSGVIEPETVQQGKLF